MSQFFALLARLLDAGLSVATGESAWPVLVISGSLGALALVCVYRLLSDSRTLTRRRERMLARALEMVLHRHDIKSSTAAVGRTLLANGQYLLSMLLPLAAATVVLSPLFVVLEGWLEWRPLRVGESTVVEVVLDVDAPVLETPLRLELSPGLRRTSDVVRSVSRNAAVFRIEAVAAGPGQIDVQAGDDIERKSVAVGTTMQRVARDRAVSGDRARWSSPLESALPTDSRIEQISIQMPEREFDLGSWTVSWLTLEVLVIGGFAIVLARFFRIALF